jgi:hypothetical protein
MFSEILEKRAKILSKNLNYICIFLIVSRFLVVLRRSVSNCCKVISISTIEVCF